LRSLSTLGPGTPQQRPVFLSRSRELLDLHAPSPHAPELTGLAPCAQADALHASVQPLALAAVRCASRRTPSRHPVSHSPLFERAVYKSETGSVFLLVTARTGAGYTRHTQPARLRLLHLHLRIPLPPPPPPAPSPRRRALR